MLGVVLWSDVSDRKAVIWCEDQGDLAYVNASSDVLNNDAFFDAGDLVQFDMETCQSMRFANNPRLVIEKAGQELPAVLKSGRDNDTNERRSADVIPLTKYRGARRDVAF